MMYAASPDHLFSPAMNEIEPFVFGGEAFHQDLHRELRNTEMLAIPSSCPEWYSLELQMPINPYIIEDWVRVRKLYHVGNVALTPR